MGSLLERPIIKNEFTVKYIIILDMLEAEITDVERLFKEQLRHKEKHGKFLVDNYMPPVAGALRWSFNLRRHITAPMTHFQALQHS